MSKRSNLKDSEEKLVLNNLGLVHHIVKRFGYKPNDQDYDDLVSTGTIGLIKAASTFDISKKIKFVTYAHRCIKNEILMYFGRETKHMYNLSLEDPITTDHEGNELTLYDKIPNSDKDFVEEMVERQDFLKCISIILNLFKSRERLILLYQIAGINQRVIAKKLDISQAHVSRLEKKLNKKVKTFYSTTKQFKEVFSMEMVGDFYQISFVSKDIQQFNKIFATFSQNLTSTEDLPDFNVTCNKKRIILQIPAHPESFSFIAQIIQEIDNYSLTYGSDKNTLSSNNSNLRKRKIGNAND